MVSPESALMDMPSVNGFRFTVGATEGQTAALRFLAPGVPACVTACYRGAPEPVEWAYEQGTLLLTLAGHPDGLQVVVQY